MRKRWSYLLLALWAALCVALAFAESQRLLCSVLTFPFEPAGRALRALSLSGTAGNVAAWCIYIVCALLPALFLLRHRPRAEDVLLPVLVVELLYVLYCFVNPGQIGMFPAGAVQGAVLGGLIWTTLLGYLVLRAMRAPRGQRSLVRLLLALLAGGFTWAACGGCVMALLRDLEALRTGNTDGWGLTAVFLGLRFLVDAVPYVLDVAVVFAGARLVSALAENRYGASVVQAAEQLARRCRVTLYVGILSGIGFDVLQVACIPLLRQVETALRLPLLSIAFTVLALALADSIRAGRTLKQDNDLLI